MKKVIENYRGRWSPAKMHGRPISSYRVQPVTFVVEEEDDECEEPVPHELIL